MAGVMLLRDFCNLNIIEINYRQSKRQSTLCSTGANVNIMAVGCATPITIVNLSGLLFNFLQISSPREALQLCKCVRVWCVVCVCVRVCVSACACVREREMQGDSHMQLGIILVCMACSHSRDKTLHVAPN